MYFDILGTADDGKLSLFILIKLSAAFDFFDYSIFIKWLISLYGFDGFKLEWFMNYLSKRSLNVRCSETKFGFVDSSVSVSQGFVFRSLLFFL